MSDRGSSLGRDQRVRRFFTLFLYVETMVTSESKIHLVLPVTQVSPVTHPAEEKNKYKENVILENEGLFGAEMSHEFEQTTSRR